MWDSSALGDPACSWSSTVTVRLKAATRSSSPMAARCASSIEEIIPPEQMPSTEILSCREIDSQASIASMIAWP